MKEELYSDLVQANQVRAVTNTAVGAMESYWPLDLVFRQSNRAWGQQLRKQMRWSDVWMVAFVNLKQVCLENLASTTPTLLHVCGRLIHVWTDSHTQGDGFGGNVAGAARAKDEMPVFSLEIAQVVEKGSEDTPSLKSLQQGN